MQPCRCAASTSSNQHVEQSLCVSAAIHAQQKCSASAAPTIHILIHAPVVASCPAGKKALAKAQAGSYDETAVRAKIESYIQDNKVGGLFAISPRQATAVHNTFADLTAV